MNGADAALPPRSTPPIVLVVDDDPSVHNLLTTMLQDRGCAVQAVPNADLAINLLQSHHVDAIVLDVKMPGRSGLDVLKYVRSSGSLREIPVFILTGAGLSPDEEQIVAAHRPYVFYKQERDLDEFASYIERLALRDDESIH